MMLNISFQIYNDGRIKMVHSFGIAALSLMGVMVLVSIIVQSPSETTDSIRETIRRHPIQVLQTYKSQHSDDVLREACQFGCDNRMFLVGYYSCPLQAGNRLHHFTNAFIWAIVTNRTLLWKYYDQVTCLALGVNHDQSICESANHETECANILQRSQWIPAHDEWNSKLKLGNATAVPYTKTKLKLEWRLKINQTESMDKRSIDLMSDKIIDIGQLLGRDADSIGTRQGREQLLQTNEARMVAKDVFSKGQRYLYGMLLDEALRFHETVRPSLDALNTIRATSTIALHSRHTSMLDQGDNIESEQRCLLQVIANISQPCTVILISDRERTLSLLSDVVTTLNCTPMLANHTLGQSFRRDHGPFSGPGFFQDLALVSQARHGYIGHKQRSSSMLVEEMIIYQRSLDDSLNPLVECYLPKH